MAGYLATNSDYLSRNSGLLAVTSSKTIMVWIRNRTTVTTTRNAAYVSLDSYPFTTDQAGLFTDTSQQQEQRSERSGGFFIDETTTYGGTSPNVWTHYAWTYHSGTKDNNFYVNGFLIGGTGYTFDLAAFSQALEVLGNNGFNNTSDHDFMYFRSWNSVLSQSEIQDELVSREAIITSNLWQDTPLISDALDISGNGRDWTVNGSITYNASDPIPSNAGWEDAIEITSLPFTDTRNVEINGVSFPIWYKYTAVTGENYLGLWGHGETTDGTGYRVITALYTVPAGTPVDYLVGIFNTTSSDPNKPVQFPVVVGTTYYFKLIPNGDYTPSNLTLSVITGPDPNTFVPDSSIFINDDAIGFGAAYISSVTGDDDNVYRYKYPFPSGEGGDILASNGQSLFHDKNDGLLKLYSNDLETELLTLAAPSGLSVNIRIRSGQALNYYYTWVKYQGALNGSSIKIVDSAGVEIQTISPTGKVNVLSPKNDGTIIYISKTTSLGVTQSAISRWSVAGAAYITDLVTGYSSHQVFDILTLADDTIVVLYKNLTGAGEIVVKRYDTSGGLLNNYVLVTGTPLPGIGEGYRLAHAIDDPTSFWVWYHALDANSLPGISIIQNIQVSDGTVLASINYTEYEVGCYTLSETDTPVRFGISSSCPFIILRTSIGPPPVPANNGGSIYIVVPGKRDDTLWESFSPKKIKLTKIPDPFVKTGLLGE